MLQVLRLLWLFNLLRYFAYFKQEGKCVCVCVLPVRFSSPIPRRLWLSLFFFYFFSSIFSFPFPLFFLPLFSFSSPPLSILGGLRAMYKVEPVCVHRTRPRDKIRFLLFVLDSVRVCIEGEKGKTRNRSDYLPHGTVGRSKLYTRGKEEASSLQGRGRGRCKDKKRGRDGKEECRQIRLDEVYWREAGDGKRGRAREKRGGNGGCKLWYRQVQQAQSDDLHVRATGEYISRPSVKPFARGEATAFRTE